MPLDDVGGATCVAGRVDASGVDDDVRKDTDVDECVVLWVSSVVLRSPALCPSAFGLFAKVTCVVLAPLVIHNVVCLAELDTVVLFDVVSTGEAVPSFFLAAATGVRKGDTTIDGMCAWQALRLYTRLFRVNASPQACAPVLCTRHMNGPFGTYVLHLL